MRPLPPLAASALIALALALPVSGCSDDDDAAATTNPGGLSDSPSKPDYITAADAICQTLYEQRDPLENQAASAAQRGNLDAAADTFDNAAAITERRFAELEALPRPAGDEQALAEIYEAGGTRTAEIAREAAAALRSGDDKAFAQASREGAANTRRFSKRAIDYGLLVCGRGRAVEIG
ncbi:MAG TPA: hypothetical protein VHH72_03800 [Solirubrobacterales bacterium]|jgi:hypothetical protein|nr:hypothetical protein [Solirubrobacterales bacterium]